MDEQAINRHHAWCDQCNCSVGRAGVVAHAQQQAARKEAECRAKQQRARDAEDVRVLSMIRDALGIGVTLPSPDREKVIR